MDRSQDQSEYIESTFDWLAVSENMIPTVINGQYDRLREHIVDDHPFEYIEHDFEEEEGKDIEPMLFL